MPVLRAFLVILCGLTPTIAAAQRWESSSCTYDRCSLRLEGSRVLRGSIGAVAASIGFLSADDMSAIMSSPDSALHYASVFDRNYARSQRMMLAGSVIGSASVLVLTKRRGLGRGTRNVLIAGTALGASSTFIAIRGIERARRALSRAIWWYNKGLAP